MWLKWCENGLHSKILVPLNSTAFSSGDIFPLPGLREELGSIILSHSAKAVVLGRECKKFHLRPQRNPLSGVESLLHRLVFKPQTVRRRRRLCVIMLTFAWTACCCQASSFFYKKHCFWTNQWIGTKMGSETVPVRQKMQCVVVECLWVNTPDWCVQVLCSPALPHWAAR